MINANHSEKKKRGQRGQSLTEFALTILIFLTFVFGSLQFGVFLYQIPAIYKAANKAARIAVTLADPGQMDVKVNESLWNSLGWDLDHRFKDACYYIDRSADPEPITVMVRIKAMNLPLPDIEALEPLKKLTTFTVRASAFRNQMTAPNSNVPDNIPELGNCQSIHNP